MQHMCVNGMPVAYWKRLSKPKNNSFFAPPSPAQDDKVIHDYLSCSGMDDCSAICLDTKFDKSQGSMPLCYLALNNRNDGELAVLSHKIIVNGSSLAQLSSRHARPLESGKASLASLIVKDVSKHSPNLAQPYNDPRMTLQQPYVNPTTTLAQLYNEPRMSLEQPYNEPIISLAQAKDDPSTSLPTPFLYPASSEGSPKDETTNTQETASNDTINLRLVYRECTVSVRGVYRKGTREPLRRYWRATTDLLNACSSSVAQQYRNRQSVVASLTSKAIPWVAVWLCFMLFSVSDAWAQSAEPRTAEGQISDKRGHRVIPYTTSNLIDKVQKTGKYDLDLYKWESYEVDKALVTKIRIGDTIPSSLLNLPLTVVGKDVPIDTITLKDLAKDKLLVIDFWTTWCAPCIGSMQKWEEIQELLPDQVALLGVHLDFAFKARPFIIDRDWNSYTSIGLNAYVLNRHFFYQDVISRVVLIKDGRFLTVGGTTGYDLSAVEQILTGEISSIPVRLEWTYAMERNLQ